MPLRAPKYSPRANKLSSRDKGAQGVGGGAQLNSGRRSFFRLRLSMFARDPFGPRVYKIFCKPRRSMRSTIRYTVTVRPVVARVSLNPIGIARRSLVLIALRCDVRPPSCLLFHRGKRIAAKSAAQPYHRVAAVITMREHVNSKRSGDVNSGRRPGIRVTTLRSAISRDFAILPVAR